MRKIEQVNHPSHYGGADNPYEAIKVIEAWSLGFHLGNTVKYIARAGRKDATLQDLKRLAGIWSERFQTWRKPMTDMQVTLLDHMGSDLTIANAARVSFHKTNAELDTSRDPKLIQYLADHNHWSPFAHCFLQFRIKAPIFVARQMVKHQVGLAWNEVSRRYVSEEPEFYFPGVWRGKPTDGAKQGSSGEMRCSGNWIADGVATNVCCLTREAYEKLLDLGVAPEMARMVLPQNMMTEWIWSGSLYAFSRVCNLRLDAHSQAETTHIAEGIADAAQPLFPHAWTALVGSPETGKVS